MRTIRARSEARATLQSADIPLVPATIVTYFNNMRKKSNTAARKQIKALRPAAVRDQQHYGQGWTHLPAFLLTRVMDQLSGPQWYFVMSAYPVRVAFALPSVRVLLAASSVSGTEESVHMLASNA
jgi:hypothetical protein